LNAAVTSVALAYVRELEGRDEAIAASLETLTSLRSRTKGLGSEAERLRAVLERFPHERAAAAGTIERREADVVALRREVAAAEEAVAQARRDREAKEAAAELARRALERAEEELSSARRRAEALVGAQDVAEREATALETASAALARELAGAPRLASRTPEPPASGLGGVAEWAARADGALLLARSGLEDEREAVVREANELAASVLGEVTVPAGVRRIRERVEAALAR
jgi:DNA repair exonuclease SbcCD ATPase subunit